MKLKIFLFTLIALLMFNSVSFAAYTKNYKLTAPENNTSLDYTQNVYNEIGDLKIEVDSTDAEALISADTKIYVKVSYDAKFTNTSDSSQTVAYKLVSGTSPNVTDLANGGKVEFNFSPAAKNKDFKIGAVITGDSSGLSDGDYTTGIKFIGLPVAGQKNYKFGNFTSGDTIVSLDWRVLSVDETNNRALLVTEKAVVKEMAYHNPSDSSQRSNKWLTSDVKPFLNGTGDNQFLKGFTAEEKARILKVKIDNATGTKDSDSSAQSKNSSEIVDSSGEDYFFLLSVADANVYFKDDGDRVCRSLTNNDQCNWWLRSPGNYDYKAAFVGGGGYVSDFGHFVYLTLAIRPAVWIDLNR